VTPTPPRQEPAVAAAEPTDAAPAPIAAVALAVPAGPSGAAMAPEVIESVPAGAAYEVTQVDSRPLVASQVAARLPDHLRERRFEEALVLRVLVTPSGRASDVRVLRRSRIDAALDAAAVAAVKQWRFSPATRRGQTVACWVSVGVPLRGDGTAGTQQ
jgi:protein TonB